MLSKSKHTTSVLKIKRALDRYMDQPYTITAAQPAAHLQGIAKALRSQGITPLLLEGIDEAWCVSTDPVTGLAISFYLGPNKED